MSAINTTPKSSDNAIPLQPLPSIFDIRFPETVSNGSADLDTSDLRGPRLATAPPKSPPGKGWFRRNWRFTLACIVVFLLIATTWVPHVASKISRYLASKACDRLDGAEEEECWRDHGYRL